MTLPKFPNPYEKGSMPYLPLGSEWEEYFSKVCKWKAEMVEKLEERIKILDVERTKNLGLMNDFYERLPNIKDTKLAMVEFKAHNDDLIDYIIMLEGLVKEVLESIR